MNTLRLNLRQSGIKIAWENLQHQCGDYEIWATASMPAGMLADLMRKDGESWEDLLVRLNDAVMKAVVEGYQVNDLHR